MLLTNEQASELLTGFFLTVCLMIPAIALYYVLREFVLSRLRDRERKSERDRRRAFREADRMKIGENQTLGAPKVVPPSGANGAKSIVVDEKAQQIPEKQRNLQRAPYGSVGVYGYGLDENPFHEEATILDRSANGGVLQMSVPVPEGRTLLLTNEATFETRACRIVRVGARAEARIEIAVEFANPCPEFWRISNRPGDSIAQEQPKTASAKALPQPAKSNYGTRRVI